MLGCFGVIVLFALVVVVNVLLFHSKGGYATKVTSLGSFSRVASVQGDVTNDGSTGDPTCTLTVYAADNSVLAERPFFPGTIYAGSDNLVSLTLSGFNVPLVDHYGAAC